MSEKSIEVFTKIKDGKSLLQIMSEMNISYTSLLKIIKELILFGYEFDKKLFSDGRTYYNLKNNDKFDNIKRINFNGNESSFRVLFLSDLHIGSINDCINLVEKTCNYAINNKIKYILNLGDFVENIYPDAKLRLDTTEKQVDFIANNYPCDRRFTHIVLYGNHDYYSLLHDGMDVAKEIELRRPDIISLGYGRGYLGIANDYICLEHECPNRPAQLMGLTNLKFIGHSHIYKLFRTQIYVPALSDETPSNYKMKPLKGFLDVNFTLKDGYISKLNIDHFVVEHSIDLASKSSIVLRKRR